MKLILFLICSKKINLFLANPNLKIRMLSSNGKLPTKAFELDAGFDLYSAERKTIKPFMQENINTDISVCEMPLYSYGRIASKSGIATKNQIFVNGGVVDGGYLGNIEVLLYNASNVDFEVFIGMKIAQLIIEKYYSCDITQQVFVPKKTSKRGENVFGCTGLY